MGHIVYAAIDADDCFLGTLKKVGVTYLPTEESLKIVHTDNQAITEDIKSQKGDTVIVGSASSRTSIPLDKLNAVKMTGKPGSFFAYLEEYAKHLNCDLDTFLLMDVFNKEWDGEEWKRYNTYARPYLERIDKAGTDKKEELKNQNDIDDADRRDSIIYAASNEEEKLKNEARYKQIFEGELPSSDDSSKFLLLYSLIHRIADKHRNDTINFRFYDDGGSDNFILEGLKDFPDHLIPRNVKLTALRWNPTESLELKTFLTKEGTGSTIDSNYRQTILKIAEIGGSYKNAVNNNDLAKRDCFKNLLCFNFHSVFHDLQCEIVGSTNQGQLKQWETGFFGGTDVTIMVNGVEKKAHLTHTMNNLFQVVSQFYINNNSPSIIETLEIINTITTILKAAKEANNSVSSFFHGRQKSTKTFYNKWFEKLDNLYANIVLPPLESQSNVAANFNASS